MLLGTIIDEAPLGSVHLRIIAIGMLVMLLEGIDIQIIGFAAPTIIRELGIEPAAFGIVFSAGLAGATIGAALLGPLGDRFGRKPLIFWSILIFALGTMATPLADSVATFIAIRLAASIGLGGVIPNLLALVAEYSPARSRGKIVASVATGQLAGGMAGGIVSGWAIPLFGWPPIFFGAGIASIALAPIAWFGLPESLRFLSQRGANAGRIAAQLRTLRSDRPDIAADVRFPPEAPQPPVTALLAPEHRMTTMLLWLAIAANLFMTAFVIYWLPTLLERMGMPLADAILAISVMNGAGIVGGLAIAPALDRWNPLKVLTAAYLAAAAAIALIGAVAPDPLGVMLVTALAGFLGLGAYAGVNVLAATLYPTSLRSAGIGWAIALGKVGSILGPLAATAGLAGGVALGQVFLISASGGVVAALALLGLRLHHARTARAARP